MIRILTLKYGDKYPSSCVNHIYDNIVKYYSKPFKLYCMTDDAKDLNSNIHILPLIYEDDIKLHWYKLKFFDMFDDTENIIMDIDQYILNDITEMIDYPVEPGNIVCYRRWWGNDNNCIINGGWYKFYGKSINKIYKRFNVNRSYWQEYYYRNEHVKEPGFGEQNFVWESCLANKYGIKYMPSSWISRYYNYDETKLIEQTHEQYAKVTGDWLYSDGEWHHDLKILHFVNKKNTPVDFNG